MNRSAALSLMHEYTPSDALRKHMYAVEAALRAYALKFGEDADTWGVVGLLHDFDYERYPNPNRSGTEEHPSRGRRSWPSAATRNRCDEPSWPTHPIQGCRVIRRSPGRCTPWTSSAVSWWRAPWLRPSRSLADLEVSSVKKKLKDKAFARNVNRDEIRQGAEELGIPLEDHIQFVIEALRPMERELGLGSAA